MQKTILPLVFILTAVSASCRGYRENYPTQLFEIRKTAEMPRSEVRIEFEFDLDSADPFDYLTKSTFKASYGNQMLKVLNRLQAFDKVTLTVADSNFEPQTFIREGYIENPTRPVYFVKYRLKRVETGNFLNFIWEVVGAFTACIIPYRTREIFTIEMTIFNDRLQGTPLQTFRYENSQTAWLSIIFAYHMMTSENILNVSDAISRDLILHSLNDLQQFIFSKALKP